MAHTLGGLVIAEAKESWIVEELIYVTKGKKIFAYAKQQRCYHVIGLLHFKYFPTRDLKVLIIPYGEIYLHGVICYSFLC